ncbi:MAG: hypothetical protein VKO39_12065 [Cyanobacteriota bacterium]|nr:hypothetical protein [Cyanobacteriota bacterium]
MAHLTAGREQRLGEGADVLLRLAQQMERQTLGRARADAGQPLKLIDQPSERSGEAAQRVLASAVNLGATGRGENGEHAAGA